MPMGPGTYGSRVGRPKKKTGAVTASERKRKSTKKSK